MGSLVIFSVDVHRLAAFYENVLGSNRQYEESGDIRLVNDREEVLIHSIPEDVAENIEIRTPPVPRDYSPMKPVFDVDSLETSLGHVQTWGGLITSRTFNLDGLIRHDVLDPDGNVIQLRSRIP